MSLSRLHQVALAVGLALPAFHVWAAPVEANLNLTNLSYTLTSLEGGSVTPSLTTAYNSAFSVYTVPNVGDYANSVSSGMVLGDHFGNTEPFDGTSADVYLPSGLGAATKQVNSQLAHSSLTAHELLNDTNRDVYSQIKVYSDYTLSAHTRMVITGDLVMSMQMDSAAISGLYANLPGTWNLTANASFRPYISTEAGVVLQTNAMSSYTDSTFGSTAQYWYWNAHATQAFTGTGASELSANNDLPEGHFQMEIVNNGDTDVSFKLNSIAYTHAIIAAVPESSTWALMSLGLIGIAAAARRRSA